MLSLIQRRLIRGVGFQPTIPIVQRSMAVMRIITPDDIVHKDERVHRTTEYRTKAVLEKEWKHTLENMACDVGYGLKTERLKKKFWKQRRLEAQEYRRAQKRVKDLIELIKLDRSLSP